MYINIRPVGIKVWETTEMSFHRQERGIPSGHPWIVKCVNEVPNETRIIVHHEESAPEEIF